MRRALLIGSIVTTLLVGIGVSTAQAAVWADADAPRRIRHYAAPIEAATGWTGLGDFLAAVAYTESRGDVRATGDGGRAWGWFQLHDGSWCLQAAGYRAAELVTAPEPLQVAVAACHAYRLGTVYGDPGQAIEWRDIRRGWRFPAWVRTSHRATADGLTIEARLEHAYRQVRVPAARARDAAFPPGFRWPGLERVIEASASQGDA